MNPNYNQSESQHTVSSLREPYNRRKIVLGGIAAIAAIIVIGVGVSLTQREADNQESVASIPAARVAMSTGNTVPTTIKVQRGQSVVWENQDTSPRQLQLTSADGTNVEAAATDQIGQGETYSYVFDEAGTYNYYDAGAPAELSGVIIVD